MHTGERVSGRIRSYIGLMTIAAATFIVFYVPQPMFNTISLEFGVDKSSAGLLVGVFMLSFAFSPLVAGMVLSKIGAKKTIHATSILMGLSGFGILAAPNFPTLLLVRSFEALLLPTLITGVLASTAGLFRHLDVKRGMAGYVFAALAGAVAGRVLGGACAELVGWRPTMAGACFLVLLAFPLAAKIPETMPTGGRTHSLKEYLSLFKIQGVGTLAYVDACGLFVFAAVGNLLAYRVAELGHAGSETVIGLMYAGYGIGLVTSALTAPMLKFFGKAIRMLLAGSLVYMASIALLGVPSMPVLFASIWVVALGQFMVHSLVPGIVNRLAESQGCDRGMTNGLYLSCFYIGGLLGSYFPGLLYTRFGWLACCACLILAQLSSFLVLLFVKKTMPAIG